jgi:hypothetical protein
MKSFAGSLLALVLVLPLSGQQSESAVPSTLSSGLELYETRENIPPEELGIYTAYEEAQRLEAEIILMFREIRAAELSMVQRQTLKRSLESILMPLSNRAEVDPGVLTKKATAADELKTYQKELSVVLQETDAIVSNARDLLESLLEKNQSAAANEEGPERQRQEQAEAMPARERVETNQSRDSQTAKDSSAKEQREQLERAVKAELEKTEIDLKQALQEIEAAREAVAKEKQSAQDVIAKETEKSAEPKDTKAAKAARKKLEELVRLDAKINKAEDAVKIVTEKVRAMRTISEIEIQQANEAMKALREALAAAKEADETSESVAQAEARAKTTEAVHQMEAANSSLAMAVGAIESLEALASGGGRGSSSKNISLIQALDELAAAESGTWLDLTDQMRGEALAVEPEEPPPGARPELWASVEELERSPTARKFSAATPRDLWIFIGDWYVLSRYNNEGRANIKKVYPPESLVDLSAQYISEDGKPLRWEYESYSPPMVAPYGWESWKIYYFWTELTFAEETEAWMAIGSDDRSDLWINDLPVWRSANRHKGWYPAEGFRKVVFREGRNTILLRLENGQSSLGFSVYLNLAE